MKRKTTFLAKAFMLFAVLFCFTGARAYEVEIGDGGETNNSYLPGYNYYKYSLTQQIYTAAEIGMAGTINSIAFKNTGAEKTRTYSVYMLHTDKETFEGGTDWASMSDDDLVFTGELTFAVNEWTTITLDTPFAYDGTSNLIVGVADNTGNDSYSPHMACLVFEATSQAIRIYRDAEAYDVSAPGVSGTVLNVKNQIVLDITPSGGTSIEAPATFEVPMVTENAARLKWTGGTGVFNVEYKKVADTEWTRLLSNTSSYTYVLNGLTQDTKYVARVQSVSGSEVSAWKSVAFTTNYVVPFPFLEDFSGTGIPNHWNKYTGLLENILAGSVTLSATTSNVWGVGTANSVLDDNHAYCNIYGTSPQKWLVTPAIPLESNARLAFDVAYTTYKGTAQAPQTTGEDDKFVVLASTDNMATWTILRQWDNAGSEFVLNDLTPDGMYVSISLGAYAGQNVNIAFYGESTVSNADNNIHIDNFAVETETSCEKPATFEVSDVTAHTAILSWTGGSGTYNVEYKKDADTEWTTAVTNTKLFSYTLTGLETNTAYQARVQSVDGSEVSGWKMVKFTTLVACPAPTSPVCIAVTTTSATLDWTENGTATWWEICLNDDEANLIEVTSKPYTLTGLTAETDYTFKVRACNSNTEKSEWSAACAFQPTTKWVIGSGTSTSQYLPSQTYYKYSLTQQIYTADELGDAASIRSIDFYSTATERTRNLDIYMVYTDKASFESASDWVPVTAGDLVFSGEVTFLQNAWTTIELDNAFSYDGSSNVILVVDDNTGSDINGSSFRVFDATAQAIRIFSDNTNYDPTDPSSYSGVVLNVKNQIRLLKGEAPTVLKPRGLAVSYTGGTEAVVSWVCDEPYFDLEVNGTVIENVANPTTLNGLELATTYEVRVRAKNETGVSDWTSPVSFTTDACLNPIVINYSLADSYGDGWSNNYILVIDEAEELAYALTLESGSSKTGTIKICGSYARFEWYAGNYPGETSWTFTDAEGNELFSGTGNTNMATGEVLYEIDNSPFKRPSDFTVTEIGPHSAQLSWTENGTATEWQICLDDDEDNLINVTTNPYTLTGLDAETEYEVKVRAYYSSSEQSLWSKEVAFTTDTATPAPTDLSVAPRAYDAKVSWNGFAKTYDIAWAEPATYVPSSDASWLQYDDEAYKTSIGNENPGTWTWGVMYPSTMLNGNLYLNKVGIYETETWTMENYTVNIYTGGDDAPETLVGTEIVAPAGVKGIHEIDLLQPVAIDPTQNLWITVTAYGTYLMTACNATIDTGEVDGDNNPVYEAERNNQWVYSGSWANIGDIASSLAGYEWMIRGFIDNITPEYNWVSKSGVKSPYTISGLAPETEYVVRVKGNFGAEGESAWTITRFTTDISTAAPTDLAVSNISDNSATITWAGYANDYNLRYRVAPIGGELTEGFEEGIGEWTTIDADGDGYTWILASELMSNYTAYNGSDMIVSQSYDTAPLEPDNYLVSPLVVLGGSITFWACAQDASYPDEHFGVAVSTTNNTDPSAFTTIQEWTMTAEGTPSSRRKVMGTWGEYTVDLSAYAGQTGYVAIRHFDCTDFFYLDIDDIVIEQPTGTEPGPWITYNLQDKRFNFTGLLSKTKYEVEIQGVYPEGNSEWAKKSFTTLEYDPDGINLAPAISEGEGNWYDLSGRKLAGKPARKGIYVNDGRKVTIK